MTLGTCAFVLGTAAAMLSPALVFVHAFGVPLWSSLGLVLLSHLGVVLLGAVAMCLSARTPGTARHG